MVASGKRSLLARVSIVDRDGNVLLDEYVKPTDKVTNYRTKISGITKQNLDKGKLFSDVQIRVSNLIKGKILVGHTLHSDLHVLGLSHPNQRDLAKYGPFMKPVTTASATCSKHQAKKDRKPQSLKSLAKEHLGKVIQEGKHDSVTDAKTAMELYNSVANKWN